MTLPTQLRAVLPADAARTWETLAEILPDPLYLGGGTALAAHLHHRQSRDLDFFYHEHSVDLASLEAKVSGRGPFAVLQRSPGTLNGIFSQTKLQFLHADEAKPQHRLDPTIRIAGVNVASIGDILAMKLKVIADRGELRDYFDLKAIEQQAGRTIDEGLTLYLARYGLESQPQPLEPVVRALGYLDDVDEDEMVPESKSEIAAYWASRQPQIVSRLRR